MTIGFRIRSVTRRATPAQCARAARLPAANIGDVMNRMQTMRGGFAPYGGKRIVAGPAFTVRSRSGDNLMLHHAIDVAEPGDVIVADGGGELAIAMTGELMMGHATERGIQGVIIDGAIRDKAELAGMDIGIWACGVTPSGPYKDGPGEIGTPCSCGGQVVMPGDLIMADEDGVVVIPYEEIEAVLAAAEAHHAKEIKAVEQIKAHSYDRRWVTESLKAKGFEGL
jgi:RraA family protein